VARAVSAVLGVRAVLVAQAVSAVLGGRAVLVAQAVSAGLGGRVEVNVEVPRSDRAAHLVT
jgi:hypothetical protein